MNQNNQTSLVTLVDKAGNPTGYAEKIEAHLRGDLHLAFSLMIMRRKAGDVEYLLQRRASNKYHSGGLWANTCCSHPLPRESVKAAAKRRVYEELGVTESMNLSTIGQICYRHQLDNNMIEHEFDNIVVAQVEKIQWHENPDEVMEVRWWKENEITNKLQNKPSQFTAWFPQVFQYIKDRSVLATH